MEMQAQQRESTRLEECSIELATVFTNVAMHWRASLATGLARCAKAADQAGLRGLNYVATLLIPHLNSSANGECADAELEHAQVFCNDLLAFCNGLCTQEQALGLASSLQKWPGIESIPDQFVEMIAKRLTSDAKVLIRSAVSAAQPLITQALETPLPASNARDEIKLIAVTDLSSAQIQLTTLPATAMEETAAPSLSQGVMMGSLSDLQADAALEVASDELLMLAEACDDLLTDVAPNLLSLPIEGQADKELWAGLLEEYKERVDYFANAATFIGLEPLQNWLYALSGNLALLCQNANLLSEPLRGLLLLIPENLKNFFTEPSAATGEQVFQLLCDSAWPHPQSEITVLASLARLSKIQIIGSRQVVERSDDVSVNDVSLEIPCDADINVVNYLLRELPQLSGEFSDAIERIAKGSSADIEQAQRIAHTLKGSANTVGVRGIANLTHQLEDILQLLAADPKKPPRSLVDHLSDAADCLAEMSEAVAGSGPEPSQAFAVYKASVVWTNRLVRDGVPSEDFVSETSTERSGPTVKPAELSPELVKEADDEILRVPASLVDRLLGFAGEASILLAQVQDRLSLLESTRTTIKTDTERLGSLSDELDRLVDVRGLSISGRTAVSDFDALELDEYNELHTVSRRISESGADAKIVDQQLDRELSSLKDLVVQLERVQTDFRETTLQTRMVLVSSITPRLQRAARQAGRMAGKVVDLTVLGGETAIDSHLLQTLIDPLMHMLRNAVDHGIESDVVRSQNGKPISGQITLGFERSGRSLKISCSDDGAGLNIAAIRNRGLERGLIGATQQYGDDEIARLILQPGFSTRDTATQLSGRGVGMDVAFNAVRQLRGTLEIKQVAGEGTTFILTLPIRMAAVPVIVAKIGKHVIGLSVRNIEQILPHDSESSVFEFQGKAVDTVRLEELIGLGFGPGLSSATHARPARTEVALLVRMDDGSLRAVVTPELSQTRNVIVRPLSRYLARIPGVEGAAVLGDGSVASVVDLPELIATHKVGTEGSWQSDLNIQSNELSKPAPVCLVVDDSVSVRRTLEYFVKDLGFEVDSAGDGIDALGCLQQRTPDLVIVDLEMPRMNGVELTATLRGNPKTANVPIIMITSRYSEKHKKMATDAGVDVFLTKPYTEDDLASHIERSLRKVAS